MAALALAAACPRASGGGRPVVALTLGLARSASREAFRARRLGCRARWPPLWVPCFMERAGSPSPPGPFSVAKGVADGSLQ